MVVALHLQCDCNSCLTCLTQPTTHNVQVALGCATLCALLPEAEMLACLVPGLYNLAFHEDARALLLRTDAVMHALAAILQANNER